MHAATGIYDIEVELGSSAHMVACWRKRSGEWSNLADDDVGECVSRKRQYGKGEGCALERFDHGPAFSGKKPGKSKLLTPRSQAQQDEQTRLVNGNDCFVQKDKCEVGQIQILT